MKRFVISFAAAQLKPGAKSSGQLLPQGLIHKE